MTGSTVIPGLQYRDARSMIDWLCRTFGFQARAVHHSDDGGVAHAELTLGSGMVMLGSAPIGDDAAAVDQSKAGPYLVVADADAVYQRAVAEGASIIAAIKDEGYGGRGFSCRDPEGYVWNVGTYDPWKT